MKVLITYHYIAHYRLPIFSELSKSKNVMFNFAAGVKTDIPIKIVTNEDLSYIKLKNYWLLNRRILWQKGILKLIFKNFDHYIFLGNPYFLSTWISLILCYFFNKKASIWTHGVTKKLNNPKKIILKILWKLSDKIYVYGHYAKNKMIEYGVKPEKIVVIYNSLDYRTQVGIKKKVDKNNVYINHFKNENPVLIFIGRLTKVKKLNQILKALNILKDSKINCNLIFIGEGEEKEKLKSLASDLAIEENIWFYGSCYEEKQIANLLVNSRVCVAPGNVGLTAMHALVYGVPVITHSDFEFQMPEFESIQDGITGSFFKKDDVFDLVNKLRYWITMSNSQYNKNSILCSKIIDEKYNPIVQKEIFENILNNEIVIKKNI